MHIYEILKSSFVVIRGLGSDLVTKVIIDFPVCLAVLAV